MAVLAGHRAVDGAFWQLPDLTPGDTVDVTSFNGRTTVWRVTGTQQMRKAELPTSLWVTGGATKLALVTCGGPFDHSTGHYLDNVIIWATPV